MKIYFAGSVRGGRIDAFLYSELILFLKDFGEVLTEHVGDAGLTQAGDEGLNDHYIHDRDMAWLLSSDILIAEVSTLSLGVGYEIGRAVAAGIPVACLFRHMPDKKLSAMIAGCPEVRLIGYKTAEEAKEEISGFLQKFIKKQSC